MKRLLAAATLTAIFSSPALGGTVYFGTPVNPETSAAVSRAWVKTSNSAFAGGKAIKFFIPHSKRDGIYGVSESGKSGMRRDYGTGGGKLSMFVRFDLPGRTSHYDLNLTFFDLDLLGVDDSAIEQFEVFDQDGNSITGLIDDISDPRLSGDHDVVKATSIAAGEFREYALLKFVFSARETEGWNGRELFLPSFTERDARDPPIAAVPLPAAGATLLTVLLGLILVSRRRQSR